VSFKDKYIEKSKKNHENKYDYSLVDYKNSKTKVKIICPSHGVFEQLPRAHSSGTGCRQCKFDGYKISDKDLLRQFKKTHKSRYDYSKVNYINSHKKITIICPTHGEFQQTPEKHKRGYGCRECSRFNYTTDDIIKQFKIIHDDKYDYSKVNYNGNHSKVKINCYKHEIFKQSSHNHKKGKGCPACNESKGEINVRKCLKKNKIKFISQKSFDECKNIKKLRFDFYLPNHNCCIEYNGIQHYNPINFFGGIKTLKHTQKRDKIKEEYCLKNNIHLLIIKYNEDVDEKLNILFSSL
jgi:hypothetical protein